MSEVRPRLVAVDTEGSPAKAPEAPERRGGVIVWIAAGLAVLFAIGWLSSARNGRALAEELSATQAGLQAAQDRVGALEGQLLQVQERTGGLVEEMAHVMGQLGALAGDLEALGAMAASDPQAGGPADGGGLSSEMTPAD